MIVFFCEVYSPLIVSQVEWLEQQVVKKRIKRDYKPSYPSQSSLAQSSSIYFNDAKWSSMWYIVSVLYYHLINYFNELLNLKAVGKDAVS